MIFNLVGAIFNLVGSTFNLDGAIFNLSGSIFNFVGATNAWNVARYDTVGSFDCLVVLPTLYRRSWSYATRYSVLGFRYSLLLVTRYSQATRKNVYLVIMLI